MRIEIPGFSCLQKMKMSILEKEYTNKIMVPSIHIGLKGAMRHPFIPLKRKPISISNSKHLLILFCDKSLGHNWL